MPTGRRLYRPLPYQFGVYCSKNSERHQFSNAARCVSANDENFAIVKNDEGRMVSTARHTSAHTSPMDGAAFGLSQSTQATSSEKASLPSSLTRYFSYQTTKRAGDELLREALPAPTIL